MSDCVYWAFQDAMKHLGKPVLKEAHDLFKAMREPALPEKSHRPTVRGYFDGEDFVEANEGWGWWWHGRPIGTYFLNYTPGAAVPIILHTLASYHGLRVVAEHDAFYQTYHWLMNSSTNPVQQNLLRTNPHLLGKEVEEYTLEPAIYLFLDGAISKHAQFFEKLPTDKGNIAAAFKLIELGE